MDEAEESTGDVDDPGAAETPADTTARLQFGGQDAEANMEEEDEADEAEETALDESELGAGEASASEESAQDESTEEEPAPAESLPFRRPMLLTPSVDVELTDSEPTKSEATDTANSLTEDSEPRTLLDESAAEREEATPPASVLRSYDVRPASGQSPGAEPAALGADPAAAPAGAAPSVGANPTASGGRASGAAASALLDQWLKPPARQALAGRPLTLHEALRAAGDRGRQLAIVKAYWRLSQAMAEYHLSVADSARVASLPRPEGARELAAWQAATAVGVARERAAELAAVAAQHDLGVAIGLSPQDVGPLAADAPFVGSYGTKFQTLFAGRPAPDSVRRIDQTLPLAQRLVEAGATAATALENAFAQEIEAYAAGQATLTELLALHAELRGQRSELLQAVREYNESIADYALFVATPGLDQSVVVKMLIVDKSMQSVLKRRDASLAAEQSSSPAARTGRLEARPAAPANSGGGAFTPK